MYGADFARRKGPVARGRVEEEEEEEEEEVVEEERHNLRSKNAQRAGPCALSPLQSQIKLHERNLNPRV